MRAKPYQLRLTLCGPKGCSPPGSSTHDTLQASTLGCVAIPFSRGSSQPTDQTRVSYVSLQWQGGSSPLAPSGKPYPAYTSLTWAKTKDTQVTNLTVPEISTLRQNITKKASWKKTNFPSNWKGRTISYLQGSAQKTTRSLLNKNFAGQKGVVWYILSDEREKNLQPKILYPARHSDLMTSSFYK